MDSLKTFKKLSKELTHTRDLVTSKIECFFLSEKPIKIRAAGENLPKEGKDP